MRAETAAIIALVYAVVFAGTPPDQVVARRITMVGVTAFVIIAVSTASGWLS